MRILEREIKTDGVSVVIDSHGNAMQVTTEALEAIQNYAFIHSTAISNVSTATHTDQATNQSTGLGLLTGLGVIMLDG